MKTCNNLQRFDLESGKPAVIG